MRRGIGVIAVLLLGIAAGVAPARGEPPPNPFTRSARSGEAPPGAPRPVPDAPPTPAPRLTPDPEAEVPPASATKERTVGEVRTIGRLVVTSRVEGHLADPACHARESLAPAPIARVLEWIRRDAELEGQPVLYDTGSLLAPHGVARFAATHAPEAFAETVASIGYEALAFGEAELGAPREGMIATVRALRERRIPVIATNLYCDPPGREMCDVLVDGRDGISIHPIGDEKVAFIAMVGPSALERISPDRAKGLRLAPVQQTLAAAVRLARGRGATMVIASIDDGKGEEVASRQLELASNLPEDAKPDLLLAAAAGDKFLFARPLGFRPAMAAAPPGSAARVRLRRNVLAETLDVLVRPVPSANGPHPAIERFIERVGPQYCDHWGRSLTGGKLRAEADGEAGKKKNEGEPEATFGGQAMLELTAGTARLATGAELALIPRSILDPTWSLSATEGLTASDVYVALRQDEPLLTADVDGSWLDTIAKGDLKKHLVMPGLTVEDGNVKVNGRALEPRARYRIVTARPATVAPHALPEGPKWKPARDVTLRSAMLDYLEEERDEDPRAALPDPARVPEWLVRTELRGTFAGTAVNNPRGDDDSPLYEETQLQRASTATFGLQATLRADATAKTWGWDNVLESRYRRTTAVGAEDTEGDDITSLRSTLRYRGWYERRERFYIPEPFVELYLETELTAPNPETEDARDYHHFLVRPTAGVQFTLTKHLSFKALGGFEVEAFDPDGEVLPGAGAQLVLKPWNLMKTGERLVSLEGNADYFVSDLGGINRQTLRGNFKARYQVSSSLSFGWDLELFVLKTKGNPAGVSSVNSAFIQIGWVGRAVGPR